MSNHRPKFDVTVHINELLNVPLVSGTCWVRWYVKDSPKPDARGRTPHIAVKEHRAKWDHEIKLQARIGVGRQNVLKEFMLVFDVMWDQNGADKMQLGKVEVNLPEYVGGGPEPKATKYLLKSSKINGALSVTVHLTQVSGTKNYTVPPMTSSAVFGDITGVLLETKDNTAEHTDILNELHHKHFSVSWNKHDYEMDPKSCIESIFQGGTGFKDNDGSMADDTRRAAPQTNAAKPDQSLGMQFHSGFDSAAQAGAAHLLVEEDEREDLRSWKLRPVS